MESADLEHMARALEVGMRGSNNEVMRFMRRHVVVMSLAVIAWSACKDSKGASPSAGSSGSGSAVVAPAKPPEKKPEGRQPIETTRDKMIQDSLERNGDKDASKG